MPRKSTKLQVVEPEVVGQSEHLELVRGLQDGITTFFRGAGIFFKGAAELRLSARTVLARAEALTVPTDDVSDKIAQHVVVDSTRGRKANTEHWEPITKVFHKVHKVLTSGRGEAEKDFVRSASIGNRLHSDYVAEQERKARIEQQRLDRLAREQAQRERDEETRRLEEERLKLEADSPNLSDREKSFVAAYDQHSNVIHAERYAGYKAGYGEKLLEREKIQTALGLLVKKREIAREQEIVRTAPVVPKATPVVRPTFGHVVGAGSRKQRGAEIYDEAALIEAILMQAANPPGEGEPVIPTDVLTVRPPKVNEYARSLGSVINEWPGVRFTQETKVTGS